MGANFSLEYRKIPFDVPSVEFTLSSEIDPSTVNSNTVTVSPNLAGYPSLKSGNVVSFALSEKMTVGSKYVFTLSKDIATPRGKTLGADYVVEIEAVGGVKVSRAIPTGETDKLSKNPVFIFNIPVVALASLSEKDKIPCPVTFEPAVPGRCSWIAGNVLEYVLDKPLAGSAKYAVTVSNSTGFLYPMKDVFHSEFTTPVLRALVDTGSELPNFSPKDGISIGFSTDVTVEALASKLELKEDVSGKTVVAKIMVPAGGDVSNSFVITGKDGPLDHSTTYKVRVAEGLMPAYGNMASKEAAEWKIRSADFISNVSVKYKRFTETGSLLDTPEVYSGDKAVPVIPAKNGILSIDFDEDVEFAKDRAYLSVGDGATRTECDLSSYDRTDTDAYAKETKHTSFKCEIPGTLQYGVNVKLVISKAVSPTLRADVTKDFVVSPEFKVSDFKLVSPTEACFYSTTGVPNVPEALVTEPVSKTREIMPDGHYEWVNGENKEIFTCPKIADKQAFVASVRLNPQTEYAFRFKKGSTDVYGNAFSVDADLGKAKTGDISEKDKYLYSSASKDINVLPSDAKIVLGLKSVNIESANIEACETDASEYFRFSANAWRQNYAPNCKKVSKIKLPLQNRHWELSPKQVDVEADILGHEAESPFVLVRGSAYDHFNVADGGYRDGDREFANFYVRSNLSLTLEKGTDRSYLFAASFDGKELPSDLSFETYSYDSASDRVSQNKAKIVWNAKRSVYEISQNSGQIAFVVAKSARYFGVLSTLSDQTSNYDFGYVSGQDSSTRDYAYVYGDHPIYRVGDTVFFKGLLRRFNPEGYSASPLGNVTVRLLDQEGQTFKEFPLKADKNSNFAGSFELPKGMKTGRYDFEITAPAPGGSQETLYVYNDGHFFVEQYVKPVFKVTASETAKDAQPKEKVEVPFSAEYYFGGAVALAPYSVGVMTQNYFFDPKDYSAYRFGTASSNYDCVYWGYCNNADQFVETLQGKLDGNGRATLSYQMPEMTSADDEKLYNFNIETTDPDTGKTVNQTVTKVLHRTDANIGIRSPYWINKGDAIKIDGVVLDHSAKPLVGKSAKVDFVRREWKEVKKLGIDGTYYSENEMVETVEKTLSATTDTEGKYRAEYLPAKGGEFEIRATYAGKNGVETASSEYAYVATDSYVAWAGTNNSVTELTAEKTVLKPGENAVFTLKSPVNSGKVFITVEKDDAILDAYVRDIASYAEKIEIPITARHIPNVYVKAFLVGKPDGAALPVYKRALSVVKVLPDEKRLTVTVSADRDRKAPGEPLTVAVFVKDALGNPVPNANGSLSVVDESVLALLGNPKKNPFAFFYEMKRYLGVETYLSLTNLVDKLEVKSFDLSNGAKGGAGEDRKGGDAKKKRGVFKDTAFWRSDFTTDKNGKFSLTTDNLPDNLTTWVIEAVVSTPSDNRIGVGEATVTTSKEVMVNDNLPRIFRSKDQTTLAPVVFNRTGADGIFDVSLAAEGFAIEKPSKKVSIKNGESATVEFQVVPGDVVLGEDRTMSKITVTATIGAKSDSIEKTVPVYRSETWETVATVGSTKDASYDEKLNLTGIDPTRGELLVRYSASLFGNAADGLQYLLRYPYGCIEQKTSAILPHVVLKRLSDAIGSEFNLDKVTVPYYDNFGRHEKSVRAVLSDYAASVATYVKGDGGFGYWPESTMSDFAMTSYAVRALGDVRTLGITADQTLLSGASTYLKREFYANKRPYCTVVLPSQVASVITQDCAYPAASRLAAVSAVLAVKSDDYEAYKMWKLLDASKFDAADKVASLSAIARIKKIPSLVPADAAALDKAADSLIDSVLKTSLVYDSRGAYVAVTDTYGESRVRVSAEFVEAVVRLGKDQADVSQILDNVSRFLARAKKADGSYGSTLDTVAAVSAFATRAAAESASVTNFVAKANLNGQNVLESGISKADVTKSFEKRLPLAGVPADSTLNFSKTGNGKLYYDLSLSYPVPAEKIAARDEGMFVKTEYYDQNDYRRVEALKLEEWRTYLDGKIRYDALKYPKDVYSYVTPVDALRIGQLVRVRYRVIAADARDRVAFESFVPAGAEIVNTRLSTESKTVEQDTFFDREEFLDDRYFGYVETLEAGDYEGSYVFRATQAGTYSVPPTKIFEFYDPEVFGRTEGKKTTIAAK